MCDFGQVCSESDKKWYFCDMKYKTMEEELKEFSVIEKINVQWGEMDSAQHVNNVVYLRWAETARIAYFYAMEQAVSPTDNTAGFILAYQDCKYIFPITYPDKVIIGIKITELQTDRFTFLAHLYSEKHQRIAAISKQVVVTFDYKKQQKVAVPQQMIDRILAIEVDKPPNLLI